MRFSERHGYTPVRTALQHESMDRELRVDLWNLILNIYEDRIRNVRRGTSPFLRDLWASFLRRPLDELLGSDQIESTLKELLMEGSWYSVYDLVEYLVGAVESSEP